VKKIEDQGEGEKQEQNEQEHEHEHEQEQEQQDEESKTNKNKTIYIDGEVKLGDDGKPMFTYDYPIISNDAGQKYYELTRGKRVTEVKYSDLYPGNKDYEEFLAMNPHHCD
jgi:hypothetical protein